MTIYPLVVNFGGVKAVLPDMSLNNRRLVCLAGNVDISTSPITLHEFGTDYQVPVGKKATVVGCRTHDGSNTSYITVFYADNADGNTNQVDMELFIPAPQATVLPLGKDNAATMAVSAPAGKYINHVSSGGARGYWLVYILEEDA